MDKVKSVVIRCLRKCKYIFLLTKQYARKIIVAWIKEKIEVANKADNPKILQFPITYSCNFDCIMCGMKNLKGKKELQLDDYKRLFDSDLFEDVISVGVNGGEPFLKKDLTEIIQLLIERLPKLKGISIISNGYFTNTILEKMAEIKALCEKNQINVNLSISIDALGDRQDFHRGCRGAWAHATETLLELNKERELYCDSLGIICTITKENVYNLFEIDAWAKQNNYIISYNIATINKRIQNEDRFDQFSVMTDDHAKMCAREFLFSKFWETKEEKYFGLFYYLCEGRRIAPCEFKRQGVSVTPNGELSFCATYSEEVGNVAEKDARVVFENGMAHRNSICELYCDNCSHYMYSLSSKGYLELIKMLMREYTRPIHI